MGALLVGEIVRRERRWTPAGATPARELVRSKAVPIPNHAPATTRPANRGNFFNILDCLRQFIHSPSLGLPTRIW